ncbi:hypothetical protein FQN54_006960 [Arachnomyces sp. PD_36]|nr:hypothetical protein FQN54_006960 [Arachnomyces sp. PD_36]
MQRLANLSTLLHFSIALSVSQASAFLQRTSGLAASPENLSASNAESSFSLLYPNNLNASDDTNHLPALKTDPVPLAKALELCETLGESLLTETDLKAHEEEFARLLLYEEYSERAHPSGLYYIDGGVVSAEEGDDESASLVFEKIEDQTESYPVLCSQSDRQSTYEATSNPMNEVSVASGGSIFIGFRNLKSFRFMGIPYADETSRFEHSKPYSKKGQTIAAVEGGDVCATSGSGSEICQFLNIQTPYIPKLNSTANLRPVLFWIHGGAFTGGEGTDPDFDGGNLASREDIVVVTINYRLGTLGFLAIPGTNITGNYGIGDQVTALQWTRENIASFGGDPDRITIAGQSAGAASVRVLLGSPPARGTFRGAIAESNLGGGVALGLPSEYSTTYSDYLTIEGSYDLSGEILASDVGCSKADVDDQVSCFKDLSLEDIFASSEVPRYVVQDDIYVTDPHLIVSARNGSTAHVPVLFGVMENDASAYCKYPEKEPANLIQGLEDSLGISTEWAQRVNSSGLFPFHSTGNFSLDVYSVAERVAEDFQFRCIDQASLYAGVSTSVFPSGYFYQMNRAINVYDPTLVGQPPVTPGYPNGNPNLPYMKTHSGELAYVFGNLDTELVRNDDDIWFGQVVSGYWGEFVKSGQPNPDPEYLRVRGYSKTLEATGANGEWKAVGPDAVVDLGQVMQLDYPLSTSTGWVDLEQCKFLNYSIDYYL